MLVFAGLTAIVALAVALSVRNAGGRRQRAVRDLLDAADQLEARLRTAREELEAVAGDGTNPVRDAMQEMLRQRLWLQQHGAGASVAELDNVRASFNSARQRIEQQLTQIERARAQFG
jgi:F0F1-type ATP synthase membrane subunit b/b'